MIPPFRAILALAVASVSFVSSGPPVRAEVVTGRIVTPSVAPSTARRGYVWTRVAAPSEDTRVSPSLAVFLRVRESLPLQAAEPAEITLRGLGLEPRMAACAVDGRVLLRNADREPATFVVGGREVGVVPPGGSLPYECTAGTSGEETRSVRVREWPRARGGIYVGEVGAPGRVDAEGRFRVELSKGTYLLRVLSIDGVVHEREVSADIRVRDVGKIEVTETGGR